MILLFSTSKSFSFDKDSNVKQSLQRVFILVKEDN